STKYIKGLIERRPDMYISEIQHNIEEAFGVEVAETTISQSLYCHGYSCKKVTRTGAKHNEELCNQFQATVSELYPPETHVYVNESACNCHTSNCDQAWAPIADRAQ
ncbi:hypothetical protein L208DRAFT_1331465, partial [Tricholoma matsutake]